MGFYDAGEQPAPRCKSPVIKCFARLVAARCGVSVDALAQARCRNVATTHPSWRNTSVGADLFALATMVMINNL